MDDIHRALILAVWEGRQKCDERFYAALAAAGISRSEFARLKGEMRAVERKLPGNLILTPMTVGRRR